MRHENGEEVLLKAYAQTLELIQGSGKEEEKLELQFRLPVEKQGVLVKAPRSFEVGEKSLKALSASSRVGRRASSFSMNRASCTSRRKRICL